MRQSRSYVVLADPPDLGSAAALAPAPALAPVDADAWVATTATVPIARAAALPAPPAHALFTAAPSPAPALATPRRTSSRPAAARAKAPAARRARAPGGPSLRTVAAGELPARLTLVAAAIAAPEPVDASVERALAAVAQAADAARAQAAAASAAAARVAALERDVERLGSEVRARRDEAAQLRQQLADAEGAGRWTLPLVALALLLAATTSWLAWRLSNLQREHQQDWRDALRAPREAADASTGRQVTSPIPFVSSEVKSPAPAAPPARPRTAPAVTPRPVEADDEPALHRTEPLAAPSLPPGTAARDVSIDELIDLEQQADFFIVLGQDDAAIDLLLAAPARHRWRQPAALPEAARDLPPSG